MEAAGNLAHVLEDRFEVALRLLEARPGLVLIIRDRVTDALEVEADRDDPLLRAVVQVALEPATRLVCPP